MRTKLTFEQWLESEKKRDPAFNSHSKGYRKILYELYVETNTIIEKKGNAPEALVKLRIELVNISIIELAKLTKATLNAADLKDLMDVLPILESQAFQGKAVNEFLDDLSAQFRDAIVERVNASASEQKIKMDYSDAQISAKVDDLVTTCIEIGRPMLLTKSGIKDAGNFDGINKSKIGKTKKWKQ